MIDNQKQESQYQNGKLQPALIVKPVYNYAVHNTP